MIRRVKERPGEMRTREAAASRAAKAAWRRLRRPARLRDWLEAFVMLGLFASLAVAASKLPTASHMTVNAGAGPALPALLVTALIALVVPALGEELVFRSLLQPARIDGAGAVLMSGLSLALFVAWHPFQVLAGLPSGQALFLAPAFLGLAAVLGLICTISVHRSGSLQPAIAMHWLVVVAWKAAGG